MNTKAISIKTIFVSIGIAVCLSSGCAKHPESPTEIVFQSDVLRAVVRPDLGGRVMSLQAHGFDNMLWTNKIVQVPLYGWINRGGEKSWIGPQESWKKCTGKTWPPPLAFDFNPYQVITQTTSSVTLRSGIDTNFNLAVQREVKLSGNTLIITSKLIPENQVSVNPELPIANWSVAQLPHAETVYVRLCGQKRFSNGSEKDKTLSPPTSVADHPDILAFSLTGIQVSGKGFFDADMFGLEVPGGCLLITQEVEQAHDTDPTIPERAQFYVGSKNDMPPGYEDYMELEFSQSYPDSEQRVSYTFIPTKLGEDARNKIINYMTTQSPPETGEW